LSAKTERQTPNDASHAERGDDHQMAQDPWERTRPPRLSVRRQTMHPHAERGDDHQMAQDPWERTRPRRLSVRRRTCIVCTGLFADKSAPTGLRSSPLLIVPARVIDHAGVGFCRRRRSLACRRWGRGRVRPKQPSNQTPPYHLLHRARRICCRFPADRRQAGLLRPPARIKNQQHHHDRMIVPTLRVVTPPGRSASRMRTRSVKRCIPTQSVGTISNALWEGACSREARAAIAFPARQPSHRIASHREQAPSHKRAPINNDSPSLLADL